jgi:hypothetical protein
MSDGKGLVIRPPKACNGETTANGKVQPDLLPVVIVYEDAATLTFGTAYISEDAYNSLLSVLTFGGATIEKATRADFDTFRRMQPNLVKRESYHAALDSDAQLKQLGFSRSTRPFGHLCQFYTRFLIPDAARPLVRAYWPEERPTYWRPPTDEAEHAIRKLILDSPLVRSDSISDPPAPWTAFRNYGNADRGLVTRVHGGLVAPSRGYLVPPAAYPATSDYRADRWPSDWTEWSSFLAHKQVFVATDINFGGGSMRGFAYCSADLRPTAEQKASLDPIAQKPKAFHVDGQEVFSNGRDFAVGDTWIFDRDETVFINNWLYLESTRGDT